MKSINPHNGELIKEYTQHSNSEVEAILEKAKEQFSFWRNTSIEQRARLMSKAGEVLRGKKKEYSLLMALEMGKPIKEGEAEVEKCAWVCDYYAENAQIFLQNEVIKSDAKESYVRFDPLGVILAIMPWNFPFWQVFRYAAPTLMAGNTGVLKHASNVTGCALEIENVFKEAGFPEGVFQTILVPGKEVSEVITDDRIAAVTITGSTPSGISVAIESAKKLKKYVLELGGSDPYIVFEDANLENAIDKISTSRMINSGQSCIAAKRFIVHKSIEKEFTQKLTEKFKAMKQGDPILEETNIGPQAKVKLRNELHEQVSKSVSLGAKIELGGELPKGNGAHYPVTLLSNVSKGMPAFDEELFGPVGTIITFSSDDEALDLANDTEFGLGSAIFTKNADRIQRFTKDIEAGSVFVNSFVKSDPRLPFGGIKKSGHGRELSEFGIKEFVNIKTISIQN